VVNWVSSSLSFSRAPATYIFTAPTYTTTIITLEPCALNAEFQHFILKISLLCKYHWKRESGVKERVTLGIKLIYRTLSEEESYGHMNKCNGNVSEGKKMKNMSQIDPSPFWWYIPKYILIYMTTLYTRPTLVHSCVGWFFDFANNHRF